MTKLTETQLAILTAAAERPDRNLLPLHGSPRGGAAGKVVGALLARGLAAETVTDVMTKADTALNRFWRNEPDGRAVMLHLTEAGLFAPQGANRAAAGAVRAQGCAEPAGGAGSSPEAASDADTGRTPRQGSKQATLIAMLRSEEGATIDEIAAATGWLPHTVRGAMAGALKKRLGLVVTSEKVDGRGRVYRLPPA